MRAGGSRERLLTPLPTHRDSRRFLQCSAIRTNRIVGRFREPPARQRLRNTMAFSAISSGDGERSKAAPLHRDPNRPRKRGNAPWEKNQLDEMGKRRFES
jgi:hypothetical protein